MSIIRCTNCTGFIDTDFESELYLRDSEEPICEECLENLEEDEVLK